MKKIVFSRNPISLDLGLLILRAGVGYCMLTHGWPKYTHFSDYVTKFPSVMGTGSHVSLLLAIFAELFCSCLLILGLATRFALLMLITTMCVVIFIIHKGNEFSKIEPALLYLIPFLTLFFTGPGKISADAVMR